jgi:demethylmenaquinone methyltransferase/2-methoxy-6-polyprenyl-1,4-benzoquinol methylase
VSTKPFKSHHIELTAPFLGEDDLAMRAYYDRRASEYDDWYLGTGLYAPLAEREGREEWDAALRELAQRIEAFGSGNILEIACGTGWWSRYLARRARVTAIDFSPRMLNLTRERLRADSLRVDLVRGDAYVLPFRAESFDAGFMGCWMSHVPYARIAELISGVRRVLRSGARLMAIDTGPITEESRRLAGTEYYNPRVLNDGSRHERVLKIDHTPETLAHALAPLGRVLQAWSTGSFVGVIVQLV